MKDKYLSQEIQLGIPAHPRRALNIALNIIARTVVACDKNRNIGKSQKPGTTVACETRTETLEIRLSLAIRILKDSS
jgi:hypothetical protein